MASAWVVEALDVLEDRVGELEAGVPPSPVEQLDLQSPPEGLRDGVVVGVADAAEEGSNPARRARSVKAQDVNWVLSTGRRNTGLIYGL